MRILLDNVNLGSTSGPNSFGRQLTNELLNQGHETINTIDLLKLGKRIQLTPPEIQLAFIEFQLQFDATMPVVQRLDGIYYNSDSQFGDWWVQNQRINQTYERANGIIFQSQFSKRLVQNFFGEKDNTIIINNGVNLKVIDEIQPIENEEIDKFDNLWVCASNWRPHKRLSENIRYFLEHSGENDALIVAGTNTGPYHDHPRITYAGELNWRTLISLYKRAKYFIHLAYHDNCPNVVVDARAAGCHVICASCGGTSEVAGADATVIVEEDWDPKPIELYKPPQLDFTKKQRNGNESSIDIVDVTRKYVDFMQQTIDIVNKSK